MQQKNDSPTPGFDHERLEVYQLALAFVREAHDLARGMPRGHAALADQLARAAISIANNIAEGSGEYSRPEKCRFYRIALRSVTEVAAAVDIASATRLVSDSRRDAAKATLHRIAAMLTALIHAVADRDEPRRTK